MKNQHTILLAITTLSTSSAFIPTSLTSPPQRYSSSRSTPLFSSTTPDHLLTSASICANSETCSIEAAENYLREIMQLQAGCGAVEEEETEICNDVGRTSEVVAGLRVKIERGAVRETTAAFWDNRQKEFESLVTATLNDQGQLSPTAALTQAPLKPAYLALAALYTIFIVSLFNPTPPMDVDTAIGGVVPFTAQEVWWSIRDGYVGDLISHLFKNGGLVVGDYSTVNTIQEGVLTPQEVWWSVRDGYVENTLSSSSSLGEDVVVGNGGVVPFQPREVFWAIRDGYLDDLIGHWFRNGGLSV